jgi:uncharacterized MAPEG superfamily protein
MTIAFWCVLVAALLPYLATLIAKTSGERYNNRDPRAWLDRQSGLSRRADNAQKNGFEAFPFFAAAVIVAQLLQAPQQRVDILAIIFIVARLAYLACYLADWQAVRSLIWMIGFVACLAIFLLGV